MFQFLLNARRALSTYCLAVQIFFIEIETSQNSYVSKAQQKRLLLNPPTSLNVCCQQLFKTVKFPVTTFTNRNAPRLIILENLFVIVASWPQIVREPIPLI